MAERRMFAKAIVNSARFLRMPQTSRLLYYDLGMAADDDGVVEAFTVLRTTGAAEDDLRVLASRGFITVLNEDLVAYITDWNVNNQLRKDRYKPSVYAELLVKLSDGNQAATNGLPSGNQAATQYSIGEVSTGEERAATPPRAPRFAPPSVEDVRAYCEGSGYSIDAEQFVDFYAANGWVQNRGKPIKDWKAAVRTWAHRDRARNGGGTDDDEHVI